MLDSEAVPDAMLAPPLQVAAGLAVVCLAMYLLWRLQRRTGNAGVVDVGWTLAIGFLGAFYAATGGGGPERRALLAAFALVWSLRLAVHLLRDRVLGRPEEGRYLELRRGWGERAERNLVVFFELQALLAVVLALPFLVVAANPRRGVDGWLVAAAGLFLVAAAGEALADRQLARFKADPRNRGRTCRSGLWRYSRHPNYFFEWLHWWCYPLLAVGSPWLWLTSLSPLLMLFLILRVTGIPPTEAQALRSRGDDYRRYQRTTSAFFPWPPRREGAP
jgi:steroid 5-alpha reductase family enzyme